MKIIKRNGSEVDFDINKIQNAIKKASDATSDSKLTISQITDIAEYVEFKLKKMGRTANVEDVQNLVEKQIMAQGAFAVAQNYIKYRYKRSLARKANSTDDKILSLLDCTNEEAKQENANKNPTIASTQRDYMAGEVSKDLTKRVLLPEDIVKAHEEGIIHFHDADYYANHIHNCFSGDTLFLTEKGLRRFDSFADGEKTIIYDKDGIKREATVHSYEEQVLQTITFKRVEPINNIIQSISIKCTKDHRWILKDGSVTTNIKVGDELYSPVGIKAIGWKVVDIRPYGIGYGKIRKKYKVWCVEEPITHSFTLSKGVVTGNCDLINLDDMLQNGTVISDTLIEKPHSFTTACTVASQISAAVASSQYGGQTMSLSHLAPFVNESRKYFKKRFREELPNLSEKELNEFVEKEVRKEVKSGVQTIQYQEITLSSTNGQAPFISLFMYLKESPEGQEREDLALIIEEVFKQRIQGVKNAQGVWVSPTFPKLLYCLEDDNIHEGDKYYYLTELAAKCTAKRLVPDYISEKIMLRDKGDVYPCMGCRSFLTPDRFTDNGVGNIANAKNYEENKHKYYGRLTIKLSRQ